MTFKSWAKVFNVVGWINAGIAFFDIGIIWLCLAVGSNPGYTLYPFILFGLAMAYICWKASKSCLEMSKLLEEEKDA